MEEAVKKLVFLNLCQSSLLDSRVIIDINPQQNILKYESLFNKLTLNFRKKIEKLTNTDFTRTQIYEYLFSYNVDSNVVINPSLYVLIEKIDRIESKNKSKFYKMILFLLYLNDLSDTKLYLFKQILTKDQNTNEFNMVCFNQLLDKEKIKRSSVTNQTEGNNKNLPPLAISESLNSYVSDKKSWCYPRKISPKFIYNKIIKRDWETIDKHYVEIPYLSEASSATFDNLYIKLFHSKNETLLDISHADFISYCFDIMTGMPSCIISEISATNCQVESNYTVSGITLSACKNYCRYFTEYGLIFIQLKEIIQKNNTLLKIENPTISTIMMICYYNSIEAFLVSCQKRILPYRDKTPNSMVSTLKALFYQFNDIKFIKEIADQIELELTPFSIDLKGYALLNILHRILTNVQFHQHFPILYKIYQDSFKPLFNSINTFITKRKLPSNSNQFLIQSYPPEFESPHSNEDFIVETFTLNENLVPLFMISLLKDVVEYNNFSKKLMNLPADMLLTPITCNSQPPEAISLLTAAPTPLFFEKKIFTSFDIKYCNDNEEILNNSSDLFLNVKTDIIFPLESTLNKYSKESFKNFVKESNYELYFKMIHQIYLNIDFDFIREIVLQIENEDRNLIGFFINQKFSEIFNKYVSQESILNNINFEILLKHNNANKISPNETFVVISFNFNPPSTCNIFFDSKVVEEYNKIFNLFLSIFYVGSLLNQVLVNLIKAKADGFVTTFLFSIVYFWKEIGSNFHDSIIYNYVDQFYSDLQRVNTIRSAFDIHHQFLENVSCRLWLNEASHDMNSQLLRIYNESINIINLIEVKKLQTREDLNQDMSNIMNDIGVLKAIATANNSNKEMFNFLDI